MEEIIWTRGYILRFFWDSMNDPKKIKKWEERSNFKRACKNFLIKKSPVPQKSKCVVIVAKHSPLNKSKMTKELIKAQILKHKDLLYRSIVNLKTLIRALCKTHYYWNIHIRNQSVYSLVIFNWRIQNMLSCHTWHASVIPFCIKLKETFGFWRSKKNYEAFVLS